MIEAFLNKSNNSVYIWKVEDVVNLRREFRISGALVGSFPQFPRQNNCLSLPLCLIPEEVTLLKEKGIITLRIDNLNEHVPSSQELDNFLLDREKLFQDQILIQQECRKNELLKHKQKIIEGKRKRKPSSSDVFNIDEIKISTLSEKNQLIQISTESKLVLPVVPATWNFPNTQNEKVRYLVFKEFWDKGFFITKGGKFGGDFLVYPGEPSCYHAFYVAVCYPQTKKFTAVDLNMLSRLGAAVKKTVVLCTVDESDCVSFTSLRWTGLSS